MVAVLRAIVEVGGSADDPTVVDDHELCAIVGRSFTMRPASYALLCM
jgi:hypothetical protein